MATRNAGRGTLRVSWLGAAKFFLAGWRLSCIFLVPPSVILYFVHSSKGLLFLLSALALVPLAAILGGATEELAIHAGPAAGGLTNATLGNAPELILGFFLLRAGHIEALKASIAGSIIGELLLVFGLAVILGGIGREKQVFNRVAVGASTTMLVLAVVGLVMPALFDLSVFGSMQPGGAATERLSFLTALILIGSYFASFIFIFRTHRDLFRSPARASAQVTAAAAVLVLVVCGGLIAFESAVLVGGIESVTRALGWTERFVGMFVIAIIGNAAEHSTAVTMAIKDKMDLALNIALGSSTQVALFVAPLLVIASHFTQHGMSLVFPLLEVVAVVISVAVATLVSFDGETNWFEGVLLISVYAILAVFFFYSPAA